MISLLGIIRNTKTMVTPQSFTTEDKENVNPDTGSLVTKKIQVEKPEPEKLVTEESDCSSDGFDVNESLELDEASFSEDDSQGKFIQNEDFFLCSFSLA